MARVAVFVLCAVGALVGGCSTRSAEFSLDTETNRVLDGKLNITSLLTDSSCNLQRDLKGMLSLTCSNNPNEAGMGRAFGAIDSALGIAGMALARRPVQGGETGGERVDTGVTDNGVVSDDGVIPDEDTAETLERSMRAPTRTVPRAAPPPGYQWQLMPVPPPRHQPTSGSAMLIPRPGSTPIIWRPDLGPHVLEATDG